MSHNFLHVLDSANPINSTMAIGIARGSGQLDTANYPCVVAVPGDPDGWVVRCYVTGQECHEWGEAHGGEIFVSPDGSYS